MNVLQMRGMEKNSGGQSLWIWSWWSVMDTEISRLKIALFILNQIKGT
jgi:hypothetical protein